MRRDTRWIDQRYHKINIESVAFVKPEILAIQGLRTDSPIVSSLTHKKLRRK